MSERRERPILFTTELVPKVMDGSKTQTRRVIRPMSYETKPEPWEALQ